MKLISDEEIAKIKEKDGYQHPEVFRYEVAIAQAQLEADQEKMDELQSWYDKLLEEYKSEKRSRVEAQEKAMEAQQNIVKALLGISEFAEATTYLLKAKGIIGKKDYAFLRGFAGLPYNNFYESAIIRDEQALKQKHGVKK